MNYPMQSYGLGGLNTVQNMSDRNMAETLMANGGQRFAGGGISNIQGMAAGGIPKYTYDPITGKYTQVSDAVSSVLDVPKYTYDPITQRYTLDTSTEKKKQEGGDDSGAGGGGSGGTPSGGRDVSGAEKAAFYGANPNMGAAARGLQSVFGLTSLGMAQAARDPDIGVREYYATFGLNPDLNSYGGASFAEQNALQAAMSSPNTGVGIPGESPTIGSESGPTGNESATDYGGTGGAMLAQGGITGSGNLDLSIPIDIGGGSMGGAGGVSGGSYPFTSIGGQGSNPQQTFGSSNNPQPFIGNNNARSMMPQQGVTFLPDPTLDPKIRQFPTDMESVRQSMMKTRGLPPNVMFAGGGIANLGDYSDGGRLLRGPGDGVSDSIPATIANKQPARLADGEFVVPARIVSELGNGSTEAGARKLYQMLARVQNARKKSIGQGRVAVNSRADKMLPA